MAANVIYYSLLQIPISVKYGHRIVFLLSTFLVREYLLVFAICDD